VNLREIVQNALKEDLPREDITTDFLELADRPGSARLVTKQVLTLSGREVFELVFRELEPAIKFSWHFDDGDTILNGKTICAVNGTLVNLLKGERTALNFLGHLSGIATLTSQFVAKMKGTKTKIIDTRKTTPNMRKLEKAAVRHGGGTNHRAHLSERILVKENHIRAVGSIGEVVNRLRSKNPGRPIEIEVTSIKEIDEALASKVEQVLLDNMSNAEIGQAVTQIAGRCLIEASGNMTLDRVESVAKLGVDFISVGKLTHSAGTADVSLLFDLKGDI
jgi:nicotinate-nucleotide pyrophosphorylase (carboxylating)